MSNFNLTLLQGWDVLTLISATNVYSGGFLGLCILIIYLSVCLMVLKIKSFSLVFVSGVLLAFVLSGLGILSGHLLLAYCIVSTLFIAVEVLRSLQ